MVEIKGMPINCTDCVFKGKLPDNQPWCTRTGEKIFQIENCFTGPLMPVAEVRSILVQARRRGGRRFDEPLDQDNFYDFKVRRSLDNCL